MSAEEFREIPIDEIDLLYKRERVDEGKLKELADSMKSVGLVHIPIARFDERTGRYQLVVGTRRYLAAKRLGLERLPVQVRDLDDVKAMILSLVENLHRENLSDMELAKRLRDLKERGRYSAKELAALLGKSESWVLDHLRMVEPIEEGVRKACEEVKPTTISIARAMEMVVNRMTKEHAKALLKQEEPVRSQLFKEIVKEAIEKGTMPSARALERRAEELKKGLAKPKEAVVEAIQAPRPSPPSAEVELKAEKPEEPEVIYRAEIKTPEDVEKAFAQVLGPKPAVAPTAPATPTPAPAITTAVEAAGVTVETAVDALNAKLRELGELLSGIEGLGSRLLGHRVRVVFEGARGEEAELEGVVTKVDKTALHLKTKEMGVWHLLYWFYVKKVGLP